MKLMLNDVLINKYIVNLKGNCYFYDFRKSEIEGLNSAQGIDEVDYAKHVEPSNERKQRHFSLAVITFTAFTFNLSFSIILTSAKPYLDQVNV